MKISLFRYFQGAVKGGFFIGKITKHFLYDSLLAHIHSYCFFTRNKSFANLSHIKTILRKHFFSSLEAGAFDGYTDSTTLYLELR